MRRLKELEFLTLLVLDTDEKSIPFQEKDVPQGLKPSSAPAQCGTAEAVPFVRLSPQPVKPIADVQPTGRGLFSAPVTPSLTNSGPAALNQNHQYDNKKYAGNYPDDRCIVHVVLPSLNG
jgi:hypothetical protein